MTTSRVSYDAFASFYDVFTENDDYDAWFRVIEEVERRHGVNVVTRAWDIGTGTGKVAERLADRGLCVIATDVSSKMLEQARLRSGNAECEFLLSDVRQQSIPEPVDLVTAIDDVFNYMASESELRSAFGNVKKSLSFGGLFVFDLNVKRTYWQRFSETNIEIHGLNDLVIVSRSVGSACKSLGDYQLLIEAYFREGDVWARRSTIQRQYYFSPATIEQLLREVGLALSACYALTQDGELVSDLDEESYFKFIYVVRNSDDDAGLWKGGVSC